jgi:carbon monoxide dehydrogenase subunit G
MITVSRVFISRPVAEVFAFVADFEQEPQWNPSLLSLRKTSPGPVGVGTTWEERVGLGRLTMVQRRRTIGYRRGAALSFCNASGFPVTVLYQFQPSNGGTLLVAASRIDLPGPLRPVGRLLRPVLRAITKRLLKRLKVVLETQAPGA